VVVDVDGRDPLGEDLELKAISRLVVGKPQIGGQRQRDKADAHGQVPDGPFIILGNKEDQQYRQKREKGDIGKQMFHLVAKVPL